MGGWRWALRQSVAAVAVLVAAGSTPYLYAFWLTGNPVFPLYNAVFHESLAPPERPADPRWIGHFSWKIPFIGTFRSSYYCEAYNGTLGFQYLALVPLALVVTVSRRLWRAGAAFAVGVVAAAALLYSMQYTRYVFPMMSLVLIALSAASPRSRHSEVGHTGRHRRWRSRSWPSTSRCPPEGNGTSPGSRSRRCSRAMPGKPTRTSMRRSGHGTRSSIESRTPASGRPTSVLPMPPTRGHAVLRDGLQSRLSGRDRSGGDGAAAA